VIVYLHHFHRTRASLRWLNNDEKVFTLDKRKVDAERSSSSFHDEQCEIILYSQKLFVKFFLKRLLFYF
jgi:hypothetical protein